MRTGHFSGTVTPVRMFPHGQAATGRQAPGAATCAPSCLHTLQRRREKRGPHPQEKGRRSHGSRVTSHADSALPTPATRSQHGCVRALSDRRVCKRLRRHLQLATHFRVF